MYGLLVRFLAVPLRADAAALREAGMTEDTIVEAHGAVDRMLPALATMLMHCTAMRVGLGLRQREVVTEG